MMWGLKDYIHLILNIFQIDVSDIRHVYKRTYRGAIIHVDTDFVVGLSGQFFLMKVLVTIIGHLSLSPYFLIYIFLIVFRDTVDIRLTDLKFVVRV